MRPVKQSKLYATDAAHRGNCMAAAFASLLEVPLWMVPAFEDMAAGLWHDRLEEWLERIFGVELVMTPGHEVTDLPEFYIASGPSPRGVAHSVVYSGGKLVHDPHPSNDGIQSVEYCWHLRALKGHPHG